MGHDDVTHPYQSRCMTADMDAAIRAISIDDNEVRVMLSSFVVDARTRIGRAYSPFFVAVVRLHW